jgi:hypothetical protein
MIRCRNKILCRSVKAASITMPLLLWLCLLPLQASGQSEAADMSEEQIVQWTLAQTRHYLAEFQHPDTGVLYGARLSGKNSWTPPADVLQEKPKPWGYGSRIADTVLHTGHMLGALLDAHAARPDPFLEEQIRIHFAALRFIGSLPETHQKPGKPALSGLVPRGPHPDDSSAYFDDSSMDQHTTYIISLALFSESSLATDEDRKWIRESLGKVGRRLEQHDWSIKRADGVTEAHVGFSWKGFNSSHASILLPSVLALYHGTGDEHWQKAYEHFLDESDGKRWQQVHPGPQVRINGHPIYANQNAFRVHAWYQLETDPERRKVIGGLLRQSVEMQLARDFPGDFYRKYHSAAAWDRLRQDFAWDDGELRGAEVAWKKFRPEMLDHKEAGLAALAHVRFPLGGFHMVLLSEQEDLIRRHVPDLWQMLNSVDLNKVEAGETHYLFTVAGLHLYAQYFRQPGLFQPSATAEVKEVPNTYGLELDLVKDAGIGPVMDVAIEGEHAFAIGRGQLHVLDIRMPTEPAVLGALSGLGSVRQILVRDGIVYISSRQDGLFIVDAADPSAPELLNHFDTVEFATGLAISGDVLFVACRHYGVELIDISKPSAPRHLSTVRTGEAQSVVARDGYLYTGVWASSEVVTVDVRDPWKPVITARTSLDGYGDGVDVKGDMLYVTTGHHSRETPRKQPGDPGFGRGHGLELFDISDPAKPQWLSRVKFPPLYEIGNDMWGVTVANGHAFVADTYNGLFVVNVADPKSPRVVGYRRLPFVESRDIHSFVGGLAVSDDCVYLAGGYSDLHLVAAPGMAKSPVVEADRAPTIGSRPAVSADRDEWRIFRPGSQVHGIDFLGDDRAVVACGSGGIRLVELWPKIAEVSQHETAGFATDVSVLGDLIFIAEGTGGLGIFRVGENGSKLKRVGNFIHGRHAIRQVEVPGDGRYVLLQAGANKFLIVDVSDPTEPKLVFEDTRHGLLYGDQLMRGLVDDRFTCVFWHVSGLHWYDLRATPQPAFSEDHYPERIGSSNGMTVFENHTLATVRGGYRLLDHRQLPAANETPAIQIGDLRHHLGTPTVFGDRLYTAHRAYGVITIVDITDSSAPRLVEEIETPGNPARISVRRNALVIANGYDGLLIRDPKR